MAAKVFISYRRDDSAGHAGRVHDRLEREFGRDLLFMDVDAIPLGADFVEVLTMEVAKCDVLLAIMGPGWLDARDDTGNRRLDHEHDFVRVEIAAALKRGIPVIPILLEGTRIPGATLLPDDLKGIVRRNGLDVRHASFHADMDKLVRALRGPPVTAPPSPTPRVPSHEERYRSEGRIKVPAPIIQGAPDGWFLPGNGKAEWFKDHEHGPEMVVVPAGAFVMGSPESEPERESWQQGVESPQHKVTIAKPVAVGRHAVTRGQFAAFVRATGQKMDGGVWVLEGDDVVEDPKVSWRSPGFSQDDRHPVVCVDWWDALAYVAWLSQLTGATYRLLSEAEREYVARANTTTTFWWGSTISPTQANYDGTAEPYKGGGAKGEWRKATVPVGSFAANPWGLFNVHGNVLEWCEDVWHDTYDGAPSDGSVWLVGDDTSLRVIRGGSWSSNPRDLRSALRNGCPPGIRYDFIGFRVARTL